jgi:glycosyltransferase involved in cell wall biosynthesis
MRIAIITDAWHPQTNGVVTTLEQTGRCLTAMGHEVLYVTPEPFRTIPMPSYPSIRLALFPRKKVFEMLDKYKPESVHVATEGPLGQAGRKYCVRRRLSFTTSYHTQFPQYVRLRIPIPLRLTYSILRRFHRAAHKVLVATESQRQELERRGFKNVVLWTRGVDTKLFKPGDKSLIKDSRPISIYMGRVAVEKNIEAFLSMQLPGTKYIVGDGPDFDSLRDKFPDAKFVGFKFGEELARYLAACDVFVFPSRTDTFGLVMLEAMACGLPVAAYPVTGPIDVIRDGETGIMRDDLTTATQLALELDGSKARAFAESRSWEAATAQFLSHLAITARPVIN